MCVVPYDFPLGSRTHLLESDPPPDYNHYSQLSSVEDNWDLGNLGLGDVNANVYDFLTKGEGHYNNNTQPPVAGVGPGLVNPSNVPGSL